MTIYNLYIFDRHCQCIYFQKWSHQSKSNLGNSVNGSSSMSQTGSSRLGLTSSRLSHSTASSEHNNNNNNNTSQTNHSASVLQSEERLSSNYMGTMTQQSGLAAGSVMSIEEEAKLVYGVILSLRNFVRKLSSNGDNSNNNQDGFISYRTSTYRLHYYETPTGLKFVLNTDPNTEGMRSVLKQIYVQLYVDFVVKNGLMRFDDTRWEISQGFLIQQQPQQQSQSLTDTDQQQTATNGQPPPGNISNELFRIAVDRFIRSLTVFE
ncbi:unnamed protein product [Cunninghamella blakesleeana]